MNPTTDQPLKLKLPALKEHLQVVAALMDNLCRLAGFRSRASRRAHLVAEDLFLRICDFCKNIHPTPRLSLKIGREASGLRLVLSMDSPVIAPELLPEDALSEMLADCHIAGVGLCLLKDYAQELRFSHSGPTHRLSLLLPPDSSDNKTHGMRQSAPVLRKNVTLEAAKAHGKLARKLTDGDSGKTFLVKSLAFEVLSRMDGKRSYGAIRSRVLQVVKDTRPEQIDEIFEQLKSLNLIKSIALAAETEPPKVEREESFNSARAIKAYEAGKK